jgi:hypothetical protein
VNQTVRVKLFQRLPRGTTLTLVMQPEEDNPDLEGITAVHQVHGLLLGVVDSTLAEPKLRMLTVTKHGVEYEGLFTLAAVIKVTDVCVPEAVQ